MNNENEIEHVAVEKLQLVSFTLGHIRLAVDIDHVQEINRQLELTPVPDVSTEIRGVINLRGDVVTVLNLYRILGVRAQPVTRYSRNLILKLDGERVGVCVDSISDILSVDADEVRTRPTNLRDVDRRYVRGVLIRQDGLVVILDPASLLEGAEMVAPAS